MPTHPPRASRLRFLLRLALLIPAMSCVYYGSAGLVFFWRERAANAAYASLRLPAAPTPRADDRLMVFSPHCDDETLGCAGLIQHTLTSGGRARVVLLTNGDAFRTAVECQAHSLQVGPADFIRFAGLRQQETANAVNALGLPAADLHFLGYPDRGLLALWNDHWTPDQPFVSPYTRCDHSPYLRTDHPRACYCGQGLLEDVLATLKAYRPTRVTVTHPSDDHGDHAAAANFVTLAVRLLQADPKEAAWARHIRLEYYLVHRGDWPQPLGVYPDAPLSPPAAMAYLDTTWTSLSLTPNQKANKIRGIDRYPSQRAMMGRFLRSFERRTELLGRLPALSLPRIPDQSGSGGRRPPGWEATPPILLDPVRDDLLRDLNGPADLRAIYACRDSDDLYVRIDSRQAVSDRYTYRLTLRPFGRRGESGRKAIQLNLHPGATVELQDGVRVFRQQRSLTAAIPWRRIAAECPDRTVKTLSIQADTALIGAPVDRTGARLIACDP